jgi:hypothetical protein
MTRPWTETETRRLRALARKRVSAEDIRGILELGLKAKN